MKPHSRCSGARSGAAPRLRKDAGLTLIELMLSSFLAFLVVVGFSSFQANISDYFRQGSERLRLQQNVNRTAQLIAIDVRKAADFRIYDPDDPGTQLLAGPAVLLQNASGDTVGGFAPTEDGNGIANRGQQVVDDMRLVDLWFEAGPAGSLSLNLALADRYGNESEIFTEITPRN